MLVAETLGEYQLIKPLGSGPLGSTFIARHRFLLKTFVLKILPEEWSLEKEFMHRFETQVRALSLLDHPNLIRLHNVCSASGKYFLVTECAQGSDGEASSLAEYLLSHTLCEEEIKEIVEQIADVLDYLHGRSEPLAHLSLKLNNILVGSVEGRLHIQLSDCGLLPIIGAHGFLTQAYQTVGNVVDVNMLSELQRSFLQNYAFLAPEQKDLYGNHKPGPSADIYAFGVLVYYLLVGSFPEGMCAPPSSYLKPSAAQWDWDLLVSACMHKDPEKRPTHLKALLSEIGSFENRSLKAVLKPQELARPEYEPDPGAIFHIESSVGRYQPQEKQTATIQPLLTEMVVIQGGSFLRGSAQGGRDEIPRHAVHIDPFALDIHPVTNEQFVRFLETMGGEKDVHNNDIIRLKEARIKRNAGKLHIESGYAKHPVVGVTWYGAVAYAKWVGKRLPTEAEWELAACGGVPEALYPTGESIEKMQANFFSSDTTPVMSYPSNGYGLFDMAGNVYEWCLDWYGYHYYEVSFQEPRNPKGPLQGVYRVLRGGCWKSLKDDMRCAHRHRNNPGTVNSTYGFRCAAEVCS